MNFLKSSPAMLDSETRRSNEIDELAGKFFNTPVILKGILSLSIFNTLPKTSVVPKKFSAVSSVTITRMRRSECCVAIAFDKCKIKRG